MYRKDTRTLNQFKKDIKECTDIENELISLWINYIDPGKKILPTGCDGTGKYLRDEEVSQVADFYIQGYGYIEVKFSKRPLKDYFHIKVNNINSYIEQRCTVLMFDGIESPRYTLISTDMLTNIVNRCETIKWKGFGGKLSYRIPLNKFIWREIK